MKIRISFLCLFLNGILQPCKCTVPTASHHFPQAIVLNKLSGKNKPSLQKRNKKILGVDPGTLLMGYSIIEAGSQQICVIEMEVLRLSSRTDHYARLQQIHVCITELIALHQPDEFAIEAPYFGKNVQSMLKLGRAQGVAISAAMHAGIPVTEYSPRKVKQAVTGNGNADKEQVWKILRDTLQLREAPKYFDATDALAIAICHHYQSRPIGPSTKAVRLKGWEDFLKQNPDRIKPRT